jgi:hypothetical protein
MLLCLLTSLFLFIRWNGFRGIGLKWVTPIFLSFFFGGDIRKFGKFQCSDEVSGGIFGMCFQAAKKKSKFSSISISFIDADLQSVSERSIRQKRLELYNKILTVP